MFLFIVLTVLNIFSTGCQSENVTMFIDTSGVRLGNNVTLTCRYYGNRTESGVLWYNGSDPTGLLYLPDCTQFSTPSPFYDTGRILPTCNSSTKVYTLTIAVTKYDIDSEWCCSFILTPTIRCSSNKTITQEDTTTTSTSTTTTPTIRTTTTATTITTERRTITVITEMGTTQTSTEITKERLIIGASVGGSVLIILIIIIICCCCKCCWFYQCRNGRKGEKYVEDSKPNDINVANKHTNGNDGTQMQAYRLTNTPNKPSTCTAIENGTSTMF